MSEAERTAIFDVVFPVLGTVNVGFATATLQASRAEQVEVEGLLSLISAAQDAGNGGQGADEVRPELLIGFLLSL